jgi:chromosome segregation ATPase
MSNRPHQSTFYDGAPHRHQSQALDEVSTVPADAKEVLVQKLQGALHAIRRDRDQEHRQRDMAVERLRSVTEAMESVIESVREEKAKLAKTSSDSQGCQREVRELESEIEVLQQKVRDVHLPYIVEKRFLDR